MPLKKPRLLLAEDHGDTRDLLTLVLTQENYEVDVTPGVATALELAKNQKFDLMILDSHLDDGSGLELCRSIRRYDRYTPIMFYSGLAYEKDKQEALSAGAQSYLVKPGDIPVLLKMLENLLAESKGTAQMHGTAGGRKDSGDLQPSRGALKSTQIAIAVRVLEYSVTLTGEGFQSFIINNRDRAPAVLN
jgi:DNA-binding response OmpR family regulator